jgi:hypothetical protein
MSPATERILATSAFCLIAGTAMAQNGVDFDQAMSGGFLQLAYGIGANSILTVVFGWLALSGLAHDPPRPVRAVCGLVGIVLYWGSAVFLGKMGIA